MVLFIKNYIIIVTVAQAIYFDFDVKNKVNVTLNILCSNF